MTLRLRLMLLVVVVVTAGLVISDVVTYTALRSFLLTRIDHSLYRASINLEPVLEGEPGAQPTGNQATGNQATGNQAAGTGTGSGSTPGPKILVPPGTYGELRTGTGRVMTHAFFDYGGKPPADPSIPAKLPGSGTSGQNWYFTASSHGPGAATYRVVARPLSGGRGTVVVAEPLTDFQSTVDRLLLIETVVSLLLLLGLSIVSWVMVRRDLRPLNEMADTASAIADGDLSLRVASVAPGTEVGELGLAFNTMIEEIEVAFAAQAASEDRLRRFLADASHELRTPLTSILGYAELFDLGIRDRPEDLATSLRYIKAEAARMGTLVDDLLLLAHLDRQRPMAQERVDLTEVVAQAVTGFAVTFPDRPVTVDTPGPAPVTGDPNRLRQVVDNLVGNALTHTPPGTPVSVGTRLDREADETVLTVHDGGAGIDPAALDRIFEPFFRADRSRNRATGGTGLGLAIVSAIVTSLGGTVSVRSGPDAGGGTTFEVRMATPGIASNGTAPLSDAAIAHESDNRAAEGEKTLHGSTLDATSQQ